MTETPLFDNRKYCKGRAVGGDFTVAHGAAGFEM